MAIFSQLGHPLFDGRATLTSGSLSATLYTPISIAWTEMYSVIITSNDTAQQSVTITDGFTSVSYLVGGNASSVPILDTPTTPVVFRKGKPITVSAGAVTGGLTISVAVRGLLLIDPPAITSGDPSSLPNLALWLRADKGISAGAIATWPDQSGNGNDYTQATGAKQPVQTSGVGPKVSLPALVFTAANSQFLSRAAAVVPQNNFTVGIVAKANSVASSMVHYCAGSAANGILFGPDNNASTKRDFNANGVAAISDTTNNATTNWELWILSCDGAGNLTLRVNGVAHTLSPSSAAIAAPTALSTIGALNGGTTRFLDGLIYEIFVYNQAVSLGNITGVLEPYESAQTGLF
jgi:hypothetical protein